MIALSPSEQELLREQITNITTLVDIIGQFRSTSFESQEQLLEAQQMLEEMLSNLTNLYYENYE